MRYGLVNLAELREQLLESWRRERGDFVLLATAAAMTFHQIHADAKFSIASDCYLSALDTAAAALSCLIPIYRGADPMDRREMIHVDLVRQRFKNGATELQCQDGTMLSPLWAGREDVLASIPKCRQVGLLIWLSPIAAGDENGTDRAD